MYSCGGFDFQVKELEYLKFGCLSLFNLKVSHEGLLCVKGMGGQSFKRITWEGFAKPVYLSCTLSQLFCNLLPHIKVVGDVWSLFLHPC